MQPCLVVDLAEQFFHSASATVRCQVLTWGPATKLQVGTVEPFCSRGRAAEHARGKADQVGWVMSVHRSIPRGIIRFAQALRTAARSLSVPDHAA